MGAGVTVNMTEIRRGARAMRAIAPEAWKACRVRLKEIGEMVAEDARQRASYSTQIPPRIKASATTAGSVRISVSGDPGVAIENGGKGFVRHPIFGRGRSRPASKSGNDWTSKNSKPAFLLPAYAARREWALEEMEKAYLDAFQRAWSRGG